MTHDLFPDDGGLARKVDPPQMDLIVGRLAPLAAMGLFSRRAMALLSPGGDETATAGGASGLVELASWDPAIAANVLASAAKNRDAALFPPAENAVAALFFPQSVAQAIEAMGTQAVHAVVLGSLGRRWPAEARGLCAWDRQEFWRHCIAVALAAEMLAKRSAAPFSPEEARTWGLLHDLGKLGLLQAMPKSYGRLLESLSAEGGGDLPRREQADLGVDHALFGRRMAQRWGFREGLQEVIWLHHQPLDSPALEGPTRLRAGLVQLADALARRLKIGWSGNSAQPVSCEVLAAQLGLEESALPAVGDRLPRECARRCDSLGVGEAGPGAAAPLSHHVAEASFGRLARAGEALRAQVRSLTARARAMDLIERFAQAHRPEATLAEVLAAAAALAGEAAYAPAPAKAGAATTAAAPPWRPAPDRPVLAYAAIPEEQTVLALCLSGAEAHACRALRMAAGAAPPAPESAGEDPAPGAPETPAQPWNSSCDLFAPAGEELRAVLADPAALGHWMDLDGAVHLALSCGPRRVGGIVVRGPLPPGAEDVLAPLLAVLGASVATCLAARQAAALGERLTEAWGRLSSERERLAEAKALQALGEMAAGAAHEINNPLAVISGRAQLMLARASSEEEKKLWRTFVNESQRISDLVTSLVEVTQPSRPRAEPVPPERLLQEANDAFAAGEHPKAAALQVDIETAEMLPSVRADRSKVVEVLRELLANAADAGASRVTLGAREGPAGVVVLTAADNGAGMDEATLAAAFTPLFSRQPAGRHRGMGLPKARSVIEALGGRMWIRSEPGSGSTVFLQLPVAD